MNNACNAISPVCLFMRAQVVGDNRLFSLYIYNEEIDKIKRTGVSTCMNISHSQHCEQRHLNKDL